MELQAFVEDTYSYYYYKRGKPNAALQYAKRACVNHSKLRQVFMKQCLLFQFVLIMTCITLLY